MLICYFKYFCKLCTYVLKFNKFLYLKKNYCMTLIINILYYFNYLDIEITERKGAKFIQERINLS